MKRLVLVLCLLVAIFAIVCFNTAAQEWRHRAVLLTDHGKHESILWLNQSEGIQVDRLILIESRNGVVRDTYEVKHVYDGHVLLKSPLRRPFVGGSKVFQ